MIFVEVSYQVEGKSSYRAHNTARPKIYKPRPCGDCSQPETGPVPRTLKTDDKIQQPTVERRRIEEKVLRAPAGSAVVREAGRGGGVEDRREPSELPLETDWPSWSSQPVSLGEHVRSVFLDLCSGVSVSQLQVMYPHQWGLLLSRLAHRPDLRLQLLDRVNRRE